MDKFSRRALLRISFTVISPTIVACLQSDRKRSFSVQQSRWNIFLRAIASFTPSNLGSVVVIFAGALQRDGSRERERERVHSLKTFHGIHSKCTSSKCDARGSNARIPAKRRRIFLSLSLFGASRRRARLWRAPSPRVVIILRVRAFPPDGNFFSLRQPAKSRNGKFSQQRDTFNLAPSLANRNNFPSPFSPARV